VRDRSNVAPKLVDGIVIFITVLKLRALPDPSNPDVTAVVI
jgi:hypothetical protein